MLYYVEGVVTWYLLLFSELVRIDQSQQFMLKNVFI